MSNQTYAGKDNPTISLAGLSISGSSIVGPVSGGTLVQGHVSALSNTIIPTAAPTTALWTSTRQSKGPHGATMNPVGTGTPGNWPIPIAGLYEFGFSGQYEPFGGVVTPPFEFTVTLVLNPGPTSPPGTTLGRVSLNYDTADTTFTNAPVSMNFGQEIYLLAGDSLRVLVFQNSGISYRATVSTPLNTGWLTLLAY